MSKRVLLAAVLVLAGFVAGRATSRPTAPPAPVAEPAEIPVAVDPTDRACRKELASARAQLAICKVYRTPPESSAPAPLPNPAAEWDDETAKLVRTGTTNADFVLVRRADGAMRTYPPGAWPPPDGPPVGSRIVSHSRKIDGGIEVTDADGGVRVLSDRPMLCPCPRDAADGGADVK